MITIPPYSSIKTREESKHRATHGRRTQVAVAFAAASIVLAATVLLRADAAENRPGNDRATMEKSWRFERAHWIYVHLEGTPSEIGYQHGWQLAPEIEDALAAVKLTTTHSTKRDWEFFRQTAREVLWPHIPDEYRQELHGIADGLAARGRSIDVWDVVALNAMEEVPDYYVPWLDRQQKRTDAPRLRAPGNCSAFVATGAWTRDHRPVIAHNNWTSMVAGARWRIIFDIVPSRGERILMDGFPGIIASDDDFGINAAGLMVTETTITGYSGFNPEGKPEFVRARQALQYATSINEFVSIMLDQNNGGYANDWLLADNKTGEIARLEIGLKLHRVWRTRDGYFVGANFPSDPEFIKQETDFDPTNAASSPNARQKRWEELMARNKGRIDVDLAQKFLADHQDSYTGKEDRGERPICGHIDRSEWGVPEWEWAPHEPAGAVNAKATDSSMAKDMSFQARSGRPCGEDFLAARFLKERPEFEWQRPILTDMKGNSWAKFKAGEKR
jgi:hypothetical protein